MVFHDFRFPQSDSVTMCHVQSLYIGCSAAIPNNLTRLKWIGLIDGLGMSKGHYTATATMALPWHRLKQELQSKDSEIAKLKEANDWQRGG